MVSQSLIEPMMMPMSGAVVDMTGRYEGAGAKWNDQSPPTGRGAGAIACAGPQ